MRANDPNLPHLRQIAHALGELREQVVLDALHRQRIKFLRRKKIAPHASRACLDSCLLWLAQKRRNGIRTPTFEHQSVFRLPSHGL